MFLRERFTLSKKLPDGQIRMGKKLGMSSMPLSDSQRDQWAFHSGFGGDSCSLHSRVPKGSKRHTQLFLTSSMKPETKKGLRKGYSSSISKTKVMSKIKYWRCYPKLYSSFHYLSKLECLNVKAIILSFRQLWIYGNISKIHLHTIKRHFLNTIY